MRETRSPRLAELGAVALLLLAAVGFFWRILLTPDAWKPAGGGDLASFLFPTYRFAAARLAAGDLPLWNPHLYGGAPFLADMQTGLFYPPNLLLFRLAPDFSYKAMEGLVVLHVFLAGLFMYLCLRYLEPEAAGWRMSRPAALLGAAAYMFSDLFIVHFGNLNLVAVAAWLPLVFFLFWRAPRAQSVGWALGAGAALGLSTLAGHLQISLYLGLTLTVLALFFAAGSARPLRPLALLVVTAAVAVGLAAMVLLPAFEYARLSPRAELPYRDAARYSLIPGLLGEMVVPALFSSREPGLYWGVWDRVAAGYLGILPLILAGLAVLLRRGKPVRALFTLAVVAFLLALGGESVFHGWAYRLLPGFGQIRAPARLVFVLDFALAALAALALERLLHPLRRRERRALDDAWRGLLWFGGGAALIGGAWAYLVVYQAADGDPTVFWRVSQATSGVIFALLMLAAALAWLHARRTGRLKRRAWAWLAVALVFVDLATVGAYADLGHEPPTRGYEHPLALQYLRSAPGFFRIDSRTDAADVWQPDLALLAGLYDVNGVDNPLVVADVARYWEGLGGRSGPLYDFLGVRYLIAGKGVELDWERFSLAFEADPAVNIYWHKTALPRAFVVRRTIVVADQEAAWTRIHQADFDPATSVVLEGGPRLDGPAEPVAAQVTRYEPDELEIEVEIPAAGVLVLSDPFYPGWQAAVDGQPVEMLRANYAFRAVALPAGSHTVTMTFRPATWRTGLVLSGLTAAVVLLGGGIALARQRDRVQNQKEGK